MLHLEDLTKGASIKGLLPADIVTVLDVQWFGTAAVELTYKRPDGSTGSEMVYRDRAASLELTQPGLNWNVGANGRLLRLTSEAYRIRLAHLFDPHLAVHTSLVEPLPHQITAVYEAMLPRQPLRFLLADDPGAGKTIMAGLLIKELLARGDLQRCLIVCPGSLAEQWQDELYRRFGLPFEIMTNDKLEAARTGNWLAEESLVIARLDKLSRDDDLLAKLELTDWDLIVCDEAHKMSATFFGGEIKYTKRYRLGQALSKLTRHFLLMTATPHNGKETDFQLFMALLDGDRFEGRFRDGVHQADTSDLMRRLIKEQLVKFDGKPLFPERRAHTVPYTLSEPEATLYAAVTNYVREEFNRADALEEGRRKGTVGFALTMLQRRLASSPEAVYQSVRRRRERLETRLREEKLSRRGADSDISGYSEPHLDPDDLDDFEDVPGAEAEALAERIVDQASAARTVAELEAEIAILRNLESLAYRVRHSDLDRKWDELSRLLQEEREMVDAAGVRRKLVIFTEHRDTLNYLRERVTTLLGRAEAVVTIHGGVGREERSKVQAAFTQDKDVQVLVATDAAGEGINLQRAHLMVNYDLPWNPNRLEQRFGRIHRIGQTEVCHLWNLVAQETREGEVFNRLFEKLENERESLGGQVFDVLGKLSFENKPLRELLVEAIRYGDRPDVRARLDQVVDTALDRERLKDLLNDHALAQDTMSASRVQSIREMMERAEARRLQPHFVAEFFFAAFRELGGSIFEREGGRFEITHVPASVRSRDRQIGTREPVLERYERVTFEKGLINVFGKPVADYVVPGHPLLNAVTDLILERHKSLLTQGAVLVDENDLGTDLRALFYLEHAVQDARTDRSGRNIIVSRQLHFVEVGADGRPHDAGYAPYLDYRPLEAHERDAVEDALAAAPFGKGNLEAQGLKHAVLELLPRHFEEVKARKETLLAKTRAAVHDRLTKEITYWDSRAAELKEQEQAGRQPRLNPRMAQRRADELLERLERRMRELDEEARLSQKPPVIIGSVLVVPAGLLREQSGEPDFSPDAEARARVERVAMETVMTLERALGHEPKDVSATKCGYDIESRPPEGGLRFIEVKGRVKGAKTVTVTKNEVLTALNKPEHFILAVVLVDGDEGVPYYLREPFVREPDFGVTSSNYTLDYLLNRAERVS